MKYIGHGGKQIMERVIPLPSEVKECIRGLERVAITGRIARECIDIAYGFFTPLEGFTAKADVEAVCEKITLANGTFWSIPIMLDITAKDGDSPEATRPRCYPSLGSGSAVCLR